MRQTTTLSESAMAMERRVMVNMSMPNARCHCEMPNAECDQRSRNSTET
jgi:hypothetical protein